MTHRNRTLSVEKFEYRQLMASDLAFGVAEALEPAPLDVNRSGAIEYLDALMVANQLQQATRYREPLDVNRDGAFNGRDFESVVAFLNAQSGFSGSMEGESESSLAMAKQGKGGGPKPPYTYWRVGTTADDTSALPSSGLGLMGGSTDVDALFQWLGGRANSGSSGGDILVLRATGTEAYNSYIQNLVPTANSVATLLIPNLAAANSPEVKSIIDQAEAIFIAGGDQADYVNFWNETPVEDAIYSALGRNVPIAGTRAGLAVLGDIDFTALTGKSITSNEALLNPYDKRITLDTPSANGFLSIHDSSLSGVPSILRLLESTITDSHFRGRDRMGRLLTFMARMDADNLVTADSVRGLGVNEETALLVEPDGNAKVVGNLLSETSLETRSVYVLQKETSPSTALLSGPLLYEDVMVFRAYSDGEHGASFHLENLEPIEGSIDSFTETYYVSATGELSGKKTVRLLSTSAGGSTAMVPLSRNAKPYELPQRMTSEGARVGIALSLAVSWIA
ncbi:dockerin type I domain-containing protein [Pirellula sp. SH-Sr6A]|uniref:dockerin type I domain-containing protein n=1 Tax=Pirellula sp. SH-Sr6A TaxID=1632865 RepID=UPI001439E3F2|nr:dockerin type I domain-containing protein [Pirellula sp. SH-Sr6A]